MYDVKPLIGSFVDLEQVRPSYRSIDAHSTMISNRNHQAPASHPSKPYANQFSSFYDPQLGDINPYVLLRSNCDAVTRNCDAVLKK